MRFFIPKPLHGWRQFAGEIAIIVIGVLIALGADQLLETRTWRDKVSAAENSMNTEIERSLAAARQSDFLKACQDRQVDILANALADDDWATANRVIEKGEYVVRTFWADDAFTAALASQIGDHIGTDRLQDYSSVYMMIRKNRQHQENGWTTDSTFAMLAMPGLPKTETVRLMQLQAVAKLRDSLDSSRSQGQLLLELANKELGLIETDDEFFARPGRMKQIAECRAAAESLSRSN